MQAGDAVPVSGIVTTMQLSSDAKHWVIVTDRVIQFWDWKKRQATDVTLEHPAAISDVIFQQDSDRMFSSDWEGNVYRWDLSKTPATHENWKHDSSVFRIAVSPDDKHVVTCDLSHTARIWEVETGRTRGMPLVHYSLIGHASFDATGQRLIIGCLDQMAKIWDVSTATPVGSPLRHPLIVNAAAFAPEGQWVWTGCGDKGLRRWKLANGRGTPLPLETNGNVIASAFTDDDQSLSLVSGTLEANTFVLPGTQMRWKHGPDGYQGVKSESVTNDAWYTVAAYAHHAKLLAAGTRTLGVRIWNSESNQPVSPEIAIDSEAKVLLFSPDDQHLLIGTTNGEVILVDVPSGKRSCESINLGSRVSAAAFFPHGKRLMVADRSDLVLMFDWTANGLKQVSELKLDSFVLSLGIDREAKRFFTSSVNGGIRVWDAATLEQLGAVMQHNARAHQVIWSGDQNRLLSGHTDGSIRVWDVRTGGLIGPPMWHRKEVMSLATDAHGTRLVTASADWSACLWDISTATGSVDVLQAQLQQATGVARQPDGSLQVLTLEEWQSLQAVTSHPSLTASLLP